MNPVHLLMEVPLLRVGQPMGEAVPIIVDAEIPALPIVADDGTYHGLFGEREFMTALFPGYLGQLRHAGFVPHSLDAAVKRRLNCLAEPVEVHANHDRIEIEPGYSDANLAEVFLHHRVLVAPVVDEQRRVLGVVTRSAFFAGLVERLPPAPEA